MFRELAFAFIPILDMTRRWFDDKLYKRYEITENEIAFIALKIRPMEAENE